MDDIINLPIHDACEMGDLDRLRDLLPQDINIENNHGFRPLDIASASGLKTFLI